MEQTHVDHLPCAAAPPMAMTSAVIEPHVLVVEDDGETRRLLVRLLRENGLRATGVGDGEEMWQVLAVSTPDLLLLDLMLPKKPGLELLRELRQEERWSGLPVIVVTARGAVGDRTRGLELGADDYVPKPFDRRELLARIAAVLRRTAAPGRASRGSLIRFAGWSLDTGRRTLTSPNGATVDLSGVEYDLLTVFLDNPKRTLSRERLREHANLWGLLLVG
jgi:two-component system OmpR family response regulator